MSHNEVECGCVLRACGMCFGPGLQKLWPKYAKAWSVGHLFSFSAFSLVAAKMFLIMPMCAKLCMCVCECVCVSECVCWPFHLA